jgi:hypothetical protein
MIRSNTHTGFAVRLAAMAAALLAIAVLAACETASTNPEAAGAAGALARLKPLAENCDGPVNGYAGLDVSASAQGDDDLIAARLAEIENVVNQVAACGGHVKVIAFASSATDTTTLGERMFAAEFGTENARLIQGDREAKELMEEIEEGVPGAIEQAAPGGTDVLAQLELARQFQAQRGEGALYVALATDGIATTGGLRMNTPRFTVEAAEEAGGRVQVPDIAGATVRIAGVGQKAGDGSQQLSTARVTALVRFHEIACERTGASCLVTTDYAYGG